MKQAVKNEIIERINKELISIRHEIDSKRSQINRLADKQRVLKKVRHELCTLINKVNGY